MKITIIKKQEVINDEVGEPSWFISLNREFKATWRNPTNLVEATLYKDEIKALRDKFNDILEKS